MSVRPCTNVARARLCKPSILCDLGFFFIKSKDIKRKVTLKAYDIPSPRQEKENKYIRTVHLACTFHSLVGRKQAKQSLNTQAKSPC